MRSARYEILAKDRTYYGEIPLAQGVHATGKTLEECTNNLSEALEGWVLLSVSRNLPLPVVDNITIGPGIAPPSPSDASASHEELIRPL